MTSTPSPTLVVTHAHPAAAADAAASHVPAPGQFRVFITDTDGAVRQVLLHALTRFEYNSDTQSWWATLAMNVAGLPTTRQIHVQFSEFDGAPIVAERWERGDGILMRAIVQAVAAKVDTKDGHEELIAALATIAGEGVFKMRHRAEQSRTVAQHRPRTGQQPKMPFLQERVRATQRAAVVTRLLHDQAPKAELDTALAVLATGPYDGPVDDILTATSAALTA